MVNLSWSRSFLLSQQLISFSVGRGLGKAAAAFAVGPACSRWKDTEPGPEMQRRSVPQYTFGKHIDTAELLLNKEAPLPFPCSWLLQGEAAGLCSRGALDTGLLSMVHGPGRINIGQSC